MSGHEPVCFQRAPDLPGTVEYDGRRAHPLQQDPRERASPRGPTVRLRRQERQERVEVMAVDPRAGTWYRVHQLRVGMIDHVGIGDGFTAAAATA